MLITIQTISPIGRTIPTKITIIRYSHNVNNIYATRI